MVVVVQISLIKPMEILSVSRAHRLASNCGRSFFQHSRQTDNPKIGSAVASRFSKKIVDAGFRVHAR